MSLKNELEKTVQRVIDNVTGSGVMQEETGADGKPVVFEGMPVLIRRAGAEGAVLLKNNGGTLPVKKDEVIALFGRCQYDWFYVGYGSGGDVNAPYTVSLTDGLLQNGAHLYEPLRIFYKAWCEKNPPSEGYWGHWPMHYPEAPLDAHLVHIAASKSDLAVVVIGRAAGEDRENTLTEGSYYLTQDERAVLDAVCADFSRVAVVMDCGNIIDMAWLEDYGDKIGAVVYAWQCGMESGNALADLLLGKENFSGKLPAAIARRYEDYPSADCFGGKDRNIYKEDIFVGYRYFETFCPDKVLFPFGFGLSYTDFEITPVSLQRSGDRYEAKVLVTNTGAVSGKEVVQLYVGAPVGRLSKAARALVAFAKTKELAPGDKEELTLPFTSYDIACFDDKERFAYVLEAGSYAFYVGSSVRDAVLLDAVELEETVLEELQEICGVQKPFERMTNDGTETVPASAPFLKERILAHLPDEIGYKGYRWYKFSEVREGTLSLEDFISQLTDEELEALTRGQGYMNSELGVEGNAGAMGGTIESLRDSGVPGIITTDGPAGIRIKRYTSLIPCGTALAASFNIPLTEALATKLGEELRERESDVLLGPGMNIHRNPLCGRNFEYFSEDPVLSGKMGAAYVRGVQAAGKAACPKHFACNNQEERRTKNDSIVSQRALREIYLKSFEICVREGKPLCVMTSYNKINGVWSHYNYDLAMTVLRGEWGFDGIVMTDWWMQKSRSPEFPLIRDNAYRVRAGVDVYMPGGTKTAKSYKSDGTLLPTLGKEGGITRGELERTAKAVLTLALRVK